MVAALVGGDLSSFMSAGASEESYVFTRCSLHFYERVKKTCKPVQTPRPVLGGLFRRSARRLNRDVTHRIS